MNCMKCGREIQEEGVFCQNCLMEMEKYPVRSDSVVLLPQPREPSIMKKTPKRHLPIAEEQIRMLRKWVIILTVIVTVCISMIMLMMKPTLHYVLDEHVEVGQNYSSVVTSADSETAESGEQP